MSLNQFDAFSERHERPFYRGFARRKLITNGADRRWVKQGSAFQQVFNGSGMPPSQHRVDRSVTDMKSVVGLIADGDDADLTPWGLSDCPVEMNDLSIATD